MEGMPVSLSRARSGSALKSLATISHGFRTRRVAGLWQSNFPGSESTERLADPDDSLEASSFPSIRLRIGPNPN